MAFQLNYNESTLKKNLDKMGTKLGAVILMYSATKASELQIVRITLAHGVEYGIWLELAHEKNYAIIAPTVREEGPRIVEDLDNLMSKLKL